MPDALPLARGKLRGSRAPCQTKRAFKLDRRSNAKPRKRNGRRLRRVTCPTDHALPDKRKTCIYLPSLCDTASPQKRGHSCNRLRVMRADATAVGSPTTFCFELCGRSDTSRALPQSSDAPPRPSANVRASVPARAPGSVRRRPRNHGPITHLPRRQAETTPPLNATYSSFDSHDGFVLGVLTKLDDRTAAARR